MFKQEAQWVAQAVQSHAKPGKIINLGSSTAQFRQVEQPWIEAELVAPLAEAGFEWVHADLKDAQGVDIVADLMDKNGFNKLANMQPNVVLCCNILEHVTNPKELLQKAFSLLQQSGDILVVTVPYRYPYHADPIDTLFRPQPHEIVDLLGESTAHSAIQHMVLNCGTYCRTVLKRPHRILDPLIKLPQLFTKPQKYLYRLGRWSYLFRPYKISAVVIQKA